MFKNFLNISAIVFLIGFTTIFLLNVNPSINAKDDSDVLGANAFRYGDLSLIPLCADSFCHFSYNTVEIKFPKLGNNFEIPVWKIISQNNNQVNLDLSLNGISSNDLSVELIDTNLNVIKKEFGTIQIQLQPMEYIALRLIPKKTINFPFQLNLKVFIL